MQSSITMWLKKVLLHLKQNMHKGNENSIEENDCPYSFLDWYNNRGNHFLLSISIVQSESIESNDRVGAVCA